jgi:hypothetical protein
MKKLFSLLAAAALAASVTPALAQQQGQDGQQKAQQGQQGQQGRQGQAGQQGRQAAFGYRGQHVMQGKITDIDRDKGTVKLDTPDGSVSLHFPPASLQGLNEGDTVDVSLAIKPLQQQRQQGGQPGQRGQQGQQPGGTQR